MNTRRRLRTATSLVIVLAALSACAGDDDIAAPSATVLTARSDTSKPATTTITTLGPPRACTTLTEAPAAGEVTWIDGHTLVGLRLNGDESECLVEDVSVTNGASIIWGGAGDRVLLSAEQSIVGGELTPTSCTSDCTVSWSKPTGKAFLVLGDDGRLTRQPIGQAPIDVTSLKRHVEATYHPAGRHIASIGEADDGTYGVFLTDNNGQGLRPLAVAETTRSLHDLAFSPSGHELYFVADHDDGKHHLHRIDLATNDLTMSYELNKPLGSVVFSNDREGELAFREGDCGSISRVIRLAATSTTQEAESIPGDDPLPAAEPIGFASNGDLIVARRSRACTGPATIVRHRPLRRAPRGPGDERTLARDVLAPSMRIAPVAPAELPEFATGDTPAPEP